MANRRMFSKEIVRSDAFLDMPVSSQLLYFHLGMEADDEGFIGNNKMIARTVGVGEDDMKILVAKRFVLPFSTGVIVIKHWLIHNTIRVDRFNPTKYQDEKKTLFLKGNKAYTDVATNGKPIGNQRVPQVKLIKSKLSKVKIRDIVTPTESPFIWVDYLKGMMENKSRHIRVIGRFFTFKSIEFSSLGEVQEAIKRHSRAAVSVGKFTNDKILQSLKECRDMKDIDFTLETVLKVLTK